MVLLTKTNLEYMGIQSECEDIYHPQCMLTNVLDTDLSFACQLNKI
jgi:hypothetical protein